MIPKHLIRRLSRDRVPISATIELTHHCNWRCVHCFVVNAEAVPCAELTTEEVQRVLGELHDLGSFFLCLTGGECLLRADFVDIVRCAADLGFAISISSNASLVTESLADELVAAHVIEFQCSLLGATPEVHDGITGIAGSHAAAWRGIDILRDKGINVFPKTPVMNRNFDDLEQIREQTKRYGLLWMTSCLLFPRWQGDREIAKLRISDEQMAELFRMQIRWSEEDKFDRNEDRVPDEEATSQCGAGVSTVTIEADGSVTPCQAYPTSAGNIREAALSEIWRQGAVFEELRTTYDQACTSADYDGPGANWLCPLFELREAGQGEGGAEELLRFNRIRLSQIGEDQGSARK